MKKATKAKQTNAQGNQKISNFFTKTDKNQVSKPPCKNNRIKDEVVLLDSDDDCLVSKPTKILSPITNVQGNKSPTNLKKRKLDLTNSPPKKKTGNDFIEHLVENAKPSTSEAPTTPIKLTIRSPEKLLTPTALREYLTPEKNPFKKVKSPSKSPAVKKINFNGDDFIVRSPFRGNGEVGMKNGSPKVRRTPKKLFEKSPDKLQEFNVEVMKNFVRITPSKSSQKIVQKEEGRKSQEKQCSILKFMSPKISQKNLEAQSKNEKTPQKGSPAAVVVNDVLKVKTRLDFTGASCSTAQKIEVPLIVHDEGFDADFDDDWGEDMATVDVYELDLGQSQHCKIVGLEKQHGKIVLTLQSTKNNEKGVCNLQGFWIYALLNVDDTVHVSAEKVNNEWVVNNEHGLLVYEPDHLVSTTSIVNSVFCKRKSVLSERFHGFEPTNQAMVIGTFIHDLLQRVVKKNCRTLSAVQAIADELANSDNTIRRLYECGMSIATLKEEFLKFTPKIVEFVDTYIEDRKQFSVLPKKYKKDDWKGLIKSVEDIEENIWCPELGVKGKIDISVKTNTNLMPLELKTGRATVSLEHRGQVMLYIMMLNKLGYDVPSGLLLYLREGVLREIPMTHKEKRDIMMLRNELVYYLKEQPRFDEQESRMNPPGLPEPINHRACENCPYNVICASYLRYNNEEISPKNVLKKIQDEALAHISDNHLKYFMHWQSLLAIEGNAKTGVKDLRMIYTMKPKDREPMGRCIINLQVTNVAEEVKGLYLHTFERADVNKLINFLACGIAENNYVVVSLDTRPAVAAGFVSYIDASSVAVLLDRNLMDKYCGKVFHVDTYDSSSIQSYNMASLTLLLELTPRAEQLRRFIIDRMVPLFETKLPRIIVAKGTPILKRLNRVQQRAVLKAIAAKDYLLIKGMPGTGKTTTIVALIQLLGELGKTVIITSHTHSAVDNVCTRLIPFGVKFMRLGAESKVHPNLKEYSEKALTKNCKTPEELEQVYNEQTVLAVTCLGSGHPILSKRTMDFCIVDESTQVLQSSVIRPIYASKTFVLIGDPDQLPTVVKSLEAVKLGMSETIFDRLSSEESTIALNLNFRMNKPITDLANCLTYNGELLIGTEAIAKATLQIPYKENLLEDYKTEKWILDAIDDDLSNSVLVLDTGPVWNLKHSAPWSSTHHSDDESLRNIYEAAVVLRVVDALLRGGVPPHHIGVIATYRAQVLLISNLLQNTKVDVSTVDRYQGKDKNIIIYSSAKSKDPALVNQKSKKVELLEDKRRLNVAITRAKNKLLLVGDATTLNQYSTFQKIFPYLKDKIISLRENQDGFSWNTVLDLENNLKVIKIHQESS